MFHASDEGQFVRIPNVRVYVAACVCLCASCPLRLAFWVRIWDVFLVPVSALKGAIHLSCLRLFVHSRPSQTKLMKLFVEGARAGMASFLAGPPGHTKCFPTLREGGKGADSNGSINCRWHLLMQKPEPKNEPKFGPKTKASTETAIGILTNTSWVSILTGLTVSGREPTASAIPTRRNAHRYGAEQSACVQCRDR